MIASATLRTRDDLIQWHFIFKREKNGKSRGLNITYGTEIVWKVQLSFTLSA